MTYRTSILLIVLIAGVSLVAFSPAAAQSDCAHLEQQVTDLTKRIEVLEKQLARAVQARKPPPVKAKPVPKGPQDIDPLYGDTLMHISGNIMKDALREALGDDFEVPYVRPAGYVEE